ncbi:iron-sulfur cluster biosynthesis family protein [Amphibacillus cookii]|uniref:iron-sulfur cluster biosynthesis family protein n=1 Tax=Amphibacillus cookii TaxID=767787 RepID=UPI00195DA956|nr:iron-sulfur cluster biosynthesis family protein [Amphibacillus cookii]MBM7541631.1 Fe-S cluster assembly iron-binding protein IscA [Amphibacillus cookii]
MMITMTKEAKNQLQSLTLAEHLLPRIDAHVAGGCGLAVNFLFIFDQPRKLDTLYYSHGMAIQVDYVTQQYLYNTSVTVDYNEEDGFCAITEFTFDGNSCS